MTYTMTNKTPFRFPTERYLNVVKRGYKDCKLDQKYLFKAWTKNPHSEYKAKIKILQDKLCLLMFVFAIKNYHGPQK